MHRSDEDSETGFIERVSPKVAAKLLMLKLFSVVRLVR